MFGIEINAMRYIAHILILVGLLGCATTGEYKLYRRDKTIDYPKEKVSLKLINDTTGIFTNAEAGRGAFNQKFSFDKVNGKYLVIRSVAPISNDFISLHQSDTIVAHKNRLHFFYNGEKKYLLSFKRK